MWVAPVLTAGFGSLGHGAGGEQQAETGEQDDGVHVEMFLQEQSRSQLLVRVSPVFMGQATAAPAPTGRRDQWRDKTLTWMLKDARVNIRHSL